MPNSESSPAFVALVQATAGAAGALIATVTLMPLEVIKTRIQVSDDRNATTLGTFKDILKRQGFTALFSGVTVKTVESTSKNFIYFYVYDALNSIVKQQTKLTTFVKLVLGFTAGVVNQTAVMPLEVLATKMQVISVDGQGLVDVARDILHKEGLRGLFKGYWFNVVLCINPAIQNTCFDKMKDAILRFKAAQWKALGKTYTYQSYPSLTPLQSFVLGAVAKAIATIVTFPLVRIKTLLQAGEQVEQGNATKATKATKAIKATSGSTIAHSGQSALDMIRQLYQGIESTLVKSVLQAALLYMAKDQIEASVVSLFKISLKMMRRRSGRIKLGVTSGRPLPS
jgi:adenine nucleotide transporter 17